MFLIILYFPLIHFFYSTLDFFEEIRMHACISDGSFQSTNSRKKSHFFPFCVWFSVVDKLFMLLFCWFFSHSQHYYVETWDNSVMFNRKHESLNCTNNLTCAIARWNAFFLLLKFASILKLLLGRKRQHAFKFSTYTWYGWNFYISQVYHASMLASWKVSRFTLKINSILELEINYLSQFILVSKSDWWLISPSVFPYLIMCTVFFNQNIALLFRLFRIWCLDVFNLSLF